MRVLIGCVAVLGAASLLMTSSATAHFDMSSKYTYEGVCSHDTWVDPLNVVFYTWGTWGRAENQVQVHAGWSNNDGQFSHQLFSDHGGCFDQHTQRASSGIDSSRYHIRFRGQHQDSSYGWTATGDAHYEDIVWPECGFFDHPKHAVRENGPTGSGFDWARNQLAVSMGTAGHYYYYAWGGNTHNFRQCDGQYARSDGNVAVIQVHQANH